MLRQTPSVLELVCAITLSLWDRNRITESTDFAREHYAGRSKIKNSMVGTLVWNTVSLYYRRRRAT